MYILILIITMLGPQPFKDVSEEMENSRCWTVSNPQDAAIIVYQHRQKANEIGQKIRWRLVGLDTDTMKAEEVKLPTVVFKEDGKAECVTISTTNKVVIATVKPAKEDEHARK